MVNEGILDKKTQSLLIVLSLLFVAIVGLTAIILMVHNNDSNTGSISEQKCMLLTDESPLDAYNACAIEMQQNNKTFDDIMAMYNAAIKAAIERNDNEFAAKLVVERNSDLVLFGWCDEAMSLIEKDDYSSFEPGLRSYIYSYMAGLAVDCKDATIQNKIRALLDNLREEQGDGIGF